MILPRLALSVRQPWAWAIIHGKDIENRGWAFNSAFHMQAKRIDAFAVHAAQGMTKAEYEDAAEFITKILGHCPPAHELVRGGIIGAVELVGTVRESASPWFFGPLGLVLRSPIACEPVRCAGQLGFFEWKWAQDAPWPDPAKWMLPKPPATLLASPRDLTDWKPDPTTSSTTKSDLFTACEALRTDPDTAP